MNTLNLSFFLFLTGFITYTQPIYAATTFSPYADISINTRWDNKSQAMIPMALDEIAASNHIKSYHLAFITDKGQCNPAWGGEYLVKDQWAANLTSSLKQQQVKTIVSFGGAAGQDLSKACSKDQLVTIFKQVSTLYQTQGLDFDIENGSTNVDKLLVALRDYQTQQPKVKISFTLPTLPEGLTPEGFSVVKKARDAKLHFSVNIMTMDYGPAYDGDMGEYAIDAAKQLQKSLKTLYPESDDELLWQRIALTAMIGVNDVAIEHFTLANADRLKQFANDAGMGGLSMWSIGRDKPCSDRFASPLCSGDNLQLKDYEFTQHFQG